MSEGSGKRDVAKMFAEAIATEAHNPPEHVMPAQTNQASDDDEVEVAPPTKPERNDGEHAELLHVNCNDEEIEINNIRLFSFTEVELDKMQNCISLGMRKNLLHELDPPFPVHLANRLVILDLFDNKIRKIPKTFFDSFTSLMKLDLSYNQIKTIENLDTLASTLCELYLVENRIKEVQGLSRLTNLRLLELGGNKIRSVGSGLDTLVNLEQLWLGKNKIAELGTAFNKLRGLKRLSLQANRLTKIVPENFPMGCHPQLEELYLSENGLTSIDNIGFLPAMRLLDFSMNPISAVNAAEVNAENMPVLEEFWLTDGKVGEWGEVDKFTGFHKTLQVLYMERNPIEQDKRYRDKVFLALPFLKQIDSWPVINKTNLEADRAIHRR